MPERKLSYKVDVDTGEAVRDLARLGKAGGDAGKDIADGFDTAETKSKAALKTLSASLDQVEQDAKGAAAAVAAIKANLTVDVDDSKVSGFVSDLKSKMGVAFDDVEQDAREFAAVLERGVDLSNTTNEIRGVGTELEHVGGEADQSRSVLANMAGNTAQDLGQLGGVVGTLGVGIGQLAEYAVDGNISLKNLGSVAGPMAALTAANLVVQGIASGLADLKKRQEEFRQQQENFNDTLRETGSLQETVNQMLQDNTELASAPELNWWQSMMDDLPVLTGMVDETSTAMQSGLVGAMAAAGISAREWTFALDNGLGPFNALNEAITDARDSGQITSDQYDLLTTQLGLYSSAALTAEVQQQNLNIVFGDGTDEARKYVKAMSPEHLQQVADKTEAVAQAARDNAAAMAATRQNAEDAFQVMRHGDWQQAKIDAATTAMGAYFATADAGLHSVGDLTEAYDALGEALDAQDGLLPDMTTPEGRATLDALDQIGQALIPQIGKAFDRSHGNIAAFRSDMQGIYDSTLTGLSNQLNISTGDVAALLAEIGFTPDQFDTMYQLNGVEEAKLKLQLLSTQIDKLPDYVQVQINQQIIAGDYQGALDTAQNAFARGVKVPLNPDPSALYKSVANFQQHVSNNPVIVPAKLALTGGGSVYTKGGGGARATVSAGPMTAGVDDAELADVDAFASSSSVGGFAVPVVTVSAPAPLTINVNAGVVGNRYDLQRWLRAATRDQQRLGRMP